MHRHARRRAAVAVVVAAVALTATTASATLGASSREAGQAAVRSGTGGLTWLGTPCGVENCRKRRRIPSSS